MDVGNINSSLVQSQLSAAQIRDKIAYAVAAKSLDAARNQGEMALELLEGAVEMADPQTPATQNPLSALGQNLDLQA